MTVTVVRYQAKPDRADENQGYIEKVYAELDATQPEGLRYMTLRLADGTFVHVGVVETEDGTSPLGSVTAFGAFTAGVGERAEAPPVAMEATVVGSYRLLP
jgi:hypothetical protein